MARGRGRPRKFVEEDVRDAILQTFWRNGFSATSLDQLSTATKLARPSLYAAFGNKSEMYRGAIETFSGVIHSAFARALRPDGGLAERLGGFFEDMLDIYAKEDATEALGCFLFGTAVVEAPNNPALKDTLQSKFLKIDAMVLKILTTHAPDAPLAQRTLAADIAAATLHSVAIRARVGFPRNELSRMGQSTVQAVTQLLPPSAPP